MNKTITINLAGFSFTVEENAYASLHTYVEAIKSFLANEEDMDEIIADIERRIAELLQEKLGDQREVVSQEDVDYVMEVLGDPKYFQSDDMEDEPTSDKEKKKRRRRSRKVYRNPDNSVIGGVCGGLGAYFNLDPLIFRLIFVVSVLTFGFGILPYLILWIVIPEAKTTAEKLEMEGEEVNVENIKNRFRKESENVKSSFRSFKQKVKDGNKSGAATQFSDTFYEILAFFGTVLRGIWMVFKKVVGFIAILAGSGLFLCVLFFILIFVFGAKNLIMGELGHLENTELIEVFFNSTGDFNFMVFLALFFIIAFVASMIFAGLSALGFKLPNKTTLGISLPVVMVISLFGFLSFLFATIHSYNNTGKIEDKILLESVSSDTLSVYANEDLYFSSDFSGHHNADFQLLTLVDEKLVSGKVLVDIEESVDSTWYVTIAKYANAKTSKEARGKAAAIDYEFNHSPSAVSFNPFFTWDKHLKYRDQKVKVTLHVPEGKYVYLSEGCDRIIYDVDNVQNMYDGNMVKKYWLMSEEGLALAK